MTEINTGAGIEDIENFHYWDAQWQQDPHPLYDRIRKEAPVAHSNRYGGFWMLSKHDDVLQAYTDPGLFSSWPNNIPAGGIGQARPVIPSEIDPPDHTHYRKIFAPLFTNARLKALEPSIRQAMRELIAPVVERGETEFVSEVGQMLPAQVFLKIMGWPLEDARMFLDWAHTLLAGIPGADEETSNAARAETAGKVYGYFGAEIAKRRANGPETGPDADFTDTLLTANFAGERPLTDDEILDCIFILLLAGLDTTAGVLSAAIEHLAIDEADRKDLLAHPEIVDTAVEEFVRWNAPVAPGRRLTRDTTIRGVEMKEGDRIMLLTGSACRDEEYFGEPAVDLRRSPNHHMGFGAGAHRCLGTNLARLMLRIALQEWHDQIPNYHIKEGTTPERHLDMVAGMVRLQIVVD